MKLTYMEPDRILSEIRQRLTIPLVNILANRHCLRHILFPFSNPLQSANATISHDSRINYSDLNSHVKSINILLLAVGLLCLISFLIIHGA